MIFRWDNRADGWIALFAGRIDHMYRLISTIWRSVMRERSLTNGVGLTTLGLGAAQFGNLYRETSDDEVVAAVGAAWDAGIRYFDTAPHYGLGLSETRLGAALQAYPRDEFVVSTKVGRMLVPNPGHEHEQDTEGFAVPAATKRQWDFSADGVRRSLDASLERLGLDRVDIVYLHDPDDFSDEAASGAIPALIELREQGVIGAVGAGMNQSAMLARFVAEHDIDLVMCAGRYTLLEQSAAQDLLPIAQERGVEVVVAGVYNSGLLSRRRATADAPYDYDRAPAELVGRANAIADICESHGVTLPEAALAFPFLHPAVSSVVLGARSRDQVESNLARHSAPVPDSLWRDLVSAGLIEAPAFADGPASTTEGRHA
jgi:D-threo-aldose 1-dehydrogenase